MFSYILFELSGLVVYTIQPSGPNGASVWRIDMPIDAYYWRDAASPQGYGPFNNVTACIDHYKWFINACRGKVALLDSNKVVDTKPVIRLDFVSKKRVTTDV